ncbi:hypothetical protein BZM27_43390 [Paraburkholderia steynii]|uniref:Uncharacterized protein n=1 Tax=Paraburkholderia steynii TaxID=1245441 RepID=A0A4R0X202_9BURK|nr:hypothetical protein BZM27_43390 [Paraburkholderia steynii]
MTYDSLDEITDKEPDRPVDTKIGATFPSTMSKEWWKTWAKQVSMERPGSPRNWRLHVAHATDEASYISGTIFAVTPGDKASRCAFAVRSATSRNCGSTVRTST